LLGRSLETAIEDPGLQPARFTVDLLRPVLMDQHDRVVSRASGLFLRRGEDPDGQVWSPERAMPPIPPAPAEIPPDLPMLVWSYGPNLDNPLAGVGADEREQAHAQKFAWVREVRRLITGESVTAFTRVAMASEVTGVATGTATIFDEQGPLGTGVAVALGQPAGAFQPPRLGP
jgi:hypothetical protein